VGKAEMVRRSMAICAVVDSLGICKVPALTLVNEFDLVSEAELVRAITGIELSPADLLLVGERILTMERIFNLRFGATGEDDELPEFFLDGPIVGGSAAGATIDLQFMLREFYEAMGWSPDGVPTAARLTELGLDMYNDEVERVRS
jgi:Aldehyde:ferredoxin oxidoreductase